MTTAPRPLPRPSAPREAAADAPALGIEPTRRVGVAPAGIGFVAVATGWGVARPAEDLRFEWSFGDADAPGFAHVDRIAAIWGGDANRAFGDRAAHVFAPSRAAFAAAGTPGRPAGSLRYTVRCTATDGTRAVTAEIAVAIENPDRVFPGERTVLVAPDGDFSGAPGDPFGRGYARARSVDGARTGDRRILFRRGTRFELSDHLSFDGVRAAAQLGAWGAGARPVLSGAVPSRKNRLIRIAKSSAQAEMAIWGIEGLSTWDPTTETAAGGVFPWGALTVTGGVQGHVTVHGCRFAGCSNTIHHPSAAARTVISDTEITDWRDYGMLAGKQNVLAIVGSRVEQNADAMGGGAVPQFIRGGSNRQNDHGPLRVGSAPAGSWTLISQTQLRSVNGWSAGNAGRGVPNRPSHQPCLRWNTRGAPDGVLRLDRVVAEGGNAALNMTTFRNRRPEKLCDIVLDKIVTIGTGNNGGSAWGCDFTGLICRNFLIVVPPTGSGRWELVPPERLMSFGGGRKAAYDPPSLEGTVEVYSGTVLDWSRTPKTLLRDNMPEGARPREVILSNVLHHAPFYPAAPRDLSEALEFAGLFGPSYRGLKWQNRHKDAGPVFLEPNGTPTGEPNSLRDVPDSPVADPAFATLARLADGTPTVALPFPAPGAPAARTGPGERAALDDLLGRLRGPMPHAGALEPR
jgi:hypothetical protein